MFPTRNLRGRYVTATCHDFVNPSQDQTLNRPHAASQPARKKPPPRIDARRRSGLRDPAPATPASGLSPKARRGALRRDLRGRYNPPSAIGARARATERHTRPPRALPADSSYTSSSRPTALHTPANSAPAVPTAARDKVPVERPRAARLRRARWPDALRARFFAATPGRLDGHRPTRGRRQLATTSSGDAARIAGPPRVTRYGPAPGPCFASPRRVYR